MRLVKMHGAGNDYLFADGSAKGGRHDWAALARAVSDRHTGVGADGLILALPSRNADLRMRMFNADGSEAEMCGNGIRCLVRFALEEGLITLPEGRPVRVETLAGVRTVQPVFRKGVMTAARVGMGKPILRPSDIPVDMTRANHPRLSAHPEPVEGRAEEGRVPAKTRAPVQPLMDHPLKVDGQTLRVTAVSMGNPHAVAFIRTPVAELPLHLVGPKVERHPLFPKRVNAEFVNVLDRKNLRARVWERGSGETMACGTGACAIGVAARLHGLTDETVDITLPGGTLRVSWDGKGEVFLEGPVAKVFDVEWKG
ncbi:MAG: diaminopimelate epimerase [Dehalococcoidia bacterium]|nr:diaminopimelate epimerase [Dehalococcoidia bacterium]